MKKTDFVTAQQAKVLAELGFNEPCLTSYNLDKDYLSSIFNVDEEDAIHYPEYIKIEELPLNAYCFNSKMGSTGCVAAPLIQQAQEWIESQLFGLCVFRYFFDGGHFQYVIWDLDRNQFSGLSADYDTKQEAVSASIDHYLQVIKEVRGVV